MAFFSETGMRIFYDRYALKGDPQQDLREGILVLYQEDYGRDVARVERLKGDIVFLETGKQVRADEVLPILEEDPRETFRRVAKAVASVEKTERLREKWESVFYKEMAEKRFLPGGRILTGAGVPKALSLYNCYVLPSPGDSQRGILKVLQEQMSIMSRGGGVGINLSTLRPRGARVAKVNGTSSGAVSWGALYSYATGLIEQGGSRRGALMLILNDWHPDIEEFVTAKRDLSYIVNANVSVGVSDAFLEAVKKDEPWDLFFPDTKAPFFDQSWNGNLKEWKEKGGPVLHYKTVPARKLWDTIIQSAWQCAEPGLWFIDRANFWSNSWYYAPLVCTNPCGEQGLPPYGVCNLGSVNLASFITPEGSLDVWSLRASVATAVRFLDNVIELGGYMLEENREQQHRERRVGIGTMGLAELLIGLGIRYGSEEAQKMTATIFRNMAEAAYIASAHLAEERGSFPAFEKEAFLRSNFVLKLPAQIRKLIEKKGIRNVTLLTQPPTGTTGTMMGTSTGIEPFFAWSYYRQSRVGSFLEKVPVYERFREKHPGEPLPEHFVTAMELTPEEHVDMQAAVQEWVDSSVSKTANVPASYTPEDVGRLYMRLYEKGCKGGTVYRDGSRGEQILKEATQEKQEEREADVCEGGICHTCE